MTREESKEHCKRLTENCEMWATLKGEKPHGKIYEEHKLILELLEQETVSKELDFKLSKLEQDKNEVLDKIRAEMLKEMLSHSGTGEEVIQAYADGLKKGLEITDKYKEESEDI